MVKLKSKIASRSKKSSAPISNQNTSSNICDFLNPCLNLTDVLPGPGLSNKNKGKDIKVKKKVLFNFPVEVITDDGKYTGSGTFNLKKKASSSKDESTRSRKSRVEVKKVVYDLTKQNSQETQKNKEHIKPSKNREKLKYREHSKSKGSSKHREPPEPIINIEEPKNYHHKPSKSRETVKTEESLKNGDQLEPSTSRNPVRNPEQSINQEAAETEAQTKTQEPPKKNLPGVGAAESVKRYKQATPKEAQEAKSKDPEENEAAQEAKQKELEARKAAQETKQKEQEACKEAQEAKQKELEARKAAQEAEQKELEARKAAQEAKKKEIEAHKTAQEAKKKELKKAQEAKKKEIEAHKAAQEAKKKELKEAEEAKKKEIEAHKAALEAKKKELKKAQEAKKKEIEAHKAAQEAKKKEQEALESKKKELENRKAAQEFKQQEQEALEAKKKEQEALGAKKKELEKRKAAQESKQQEQEAQEVKMKELQRFKEDQQTKKKELEARKKALKKELEARKEAIKKQVEEEKRAKAELEEINKIFRPGECLKHMTIEVHPELGSKWYMEDVKRSAAEAGLPLLPAEDICDPELLMWTRRVPATLANFDGQVQLTATKKQCNHVLYIASALDLLPLVLENKLHERLAHKQELVGGYLTMVVVAPQDIQMLARNDNVKAEKFQYAFQQIQLELVAEENIGCTVVHTPTDLADLVMMYTRAIAEAPFKKAKRDIDEQAEFFMRGDNKNCVTVDKDGNGMSRLWEQMLAVLPQSSLEVARSLGAEYKTPNALAKALQSSGGTETIANIGVTRTNVPDAKSRKLGKEFARKLHILFTSEDENAVIE